MDYSEYYEYDADRIEHLRGENYDSFRELIMSSTEDTLEMIEHDFRAAYDFSIEDLVYTYSDMVDFICDVFNIAKEIEDYEVCAKIHPIFKPMFKKLDLIEIQIEELEL